MFKVYFTNFGYYSDYNFSNAFDALEYLTSTSFEGRVELPQSKSNSKLNLILVTYSPLTGVNWRQGYSLRSQITHPFAATILGDRELIWPENKPITLGDCQRIWKFSA